MHNDDPLFDEVGAGKYLGGEDSPVSPRSMQRWRLEDTGPEYVKIGKLIRYQKSALDAKLAACVRGSTSEPDPAAAPAKAA